MNVSIVIPIYNEEKHIVECLESLLKQDYKGTVELLLVDGGSEDQSRIIISKYIAQYENIRLLNNTKRITPAAMNIGINHSSGDLIVIMGAHAKYARDYISKCVKWSKKTGADNVGGPAMAQGNGFWGRAISYAHYSPFGLGGAAFRTGNFEGYTDTVFGGAFRREVFQKVGLFDERLIRNQDIHLNSRIRSSGGKIFITPEIQCAYYCRSNLWELWKQNYETGLWSIYTLSISKAALSIRHFVPLIFVICLVISFLSLLLGMVISVDFPWYVFLIPFILCLGSYLFVASVYSLLIALKHGLRYFLPMFAVFATLHISYGLGSLNGLLTIRRWTQLYS